MTADNGKMTALDPMRVPTDASVVPIAPEHIESFQRAIDSVARERKFLTLLEALPLPQTREFVLNNIRSGNPQFVALAKGEVVGWCDIRRHFFPAHAHRGALGMGIVRAYRGRGLGTRLINATLEAAFGAGFVRVELDVHADNARAISLSERVGFVREGIVRDAVYVDGEYRDAITMALLRRLKV
jgi:RimJ/RimL family protein N-acetyltransferase